MLEYAIIGAGFGGIAMARALHDAGVANFRVFEKAAEVGGTWRENHYPGAACDVPSHLYSLADAPNPDWTRLFPQQPEIQAHLRLLGAELVARGQIEFRWQLSAANWDAQDQSWLLENAQGERCRARMLVLALGGLHVPAYPEIPGLGSFSGESFHSARWRHDLPLAGRRVAVIGTGASAIQFIPAIAPQVASLSVCQRSPAWLMPRTDIEFSPRLKRAFARWPWLRKTLRGSIFTLLELLSSALIHRRTAFWARAMSRRHLRKQVVDPALRARLTPDYPFGCKRVLISSDYYPALQLPQVELIDTPVTAVEPEGLLLADGRRLPVDVLIYGTGFKPLDVLSGLRIVGRDGRQLDVDWARRPQAHLGISPHGYPNLHFLLGPNTALGHNSVLNMIESQVRHILALRRAMAEHGARSVEATAAAQQGYLDRVDRGFGDSAWAGGCHSWYLDDSGQNIALWTGSCVGYRWLTRKVRAGDYVFG
ncbi:MAG: NAD(P)/FAD-dependent oxidoreductase [Rhodanobacteraceae bacterium]|nr:NAD(P)/FAD-dependent oxidoreductase [Rhodanobacteraceae bacterium]